MSDEIDLSFSREGRPLKEWLLDLISEDQATRTRAGEMVMVISWGIAAPETDISSLGEEGREEAFAAAVESALSADDFPARAFLMTAAQQLVASHATWMAHFEHVDEQYERILDRLAERAKSADTEQAKQATLRRMGRAMCASIARESEAEDDQALIQNMTTSTVLGQVVGNAGSTIAAAPEAIWMLLESQGNGHVAAEALTRAGPTVAPLFLDELLTVYLDEWNSSQRFNHSRMLASVGRGNLKVIRAMLERMQQPSATASSGRDTRFDFASVLGQMGDAAATPEVVEVFRRFSTSGDEEQRAMAAAYLCELLPDKDEAVDRLLALSHDESSEVVGLAIAGLGQSARQPARVVPRLAELLEGFEEYDPDMGYGGDAARVCEALKRFGGDAAPAVPALAAYLQRRAEGNDPRYDDWNFPSEVLDVLEAVGDAAAPALPALRAVREAEQRDRARTAAEEAMRDDEEDDDQGVEEDEQELDELVRLNRLIARLDA